VGGAHVAACVNAAERSRDDVVGGERVAEPGGPAADPAERLLGEGLAGRSLMGVASALEPVPPAASLARGLAADDAGLGHRRPIVAMT
jgi:hypothetical protein